MPRHNRSGGCIFSPGRWCGRPLQGGSAAYIRTSYIHTHTPREPKKDLKIANNAVPPRTQNRQTTTARKKHTVLSSLAHQLKLGAPLGEEVLPDQCQKLPKEIGHQRRLLVLPILSAHRRNSHRSHVVAEASIEAGEGPQTRVVCPTRARFAGTHLNDILCRREGREKRKISFPGRFCRFRFGMEAGYLSGFKHVHRLARSCAGE